MAKVNIYNIADYFLYLSSPGTAKEITPLKLQKLSFYAQALSYKVLKRELFEEDFEAWVHGPVSPELYYEYKSYGASPIDRVEKIPKSLSKQEKLIVDMIWKKYGEKDGKYLENKTHKEEPWMKARKNLSYFDHSNKVISKESIKDYYTKTFTINKKVNS